MILLYFKGPGEPKIDKISIKSRTWKHTKKTYVLLIKKTKKCDFRVPLGTLKGGPRTNFFGTFSALEAQGIQKAPRCPPRGPRDRPRPRFLLILNGCLTVFRLFLNTRINVEAEAQREEQKKTPALCFVFETFLVREAQAQYRQPETPVL